jgi:hypothetical protein
MRFIDLMLGTLLFVLAMILAGIALPVSWLAEGLWWLVERIMQSRKAENE